MTSSSWPRIVAESLRRLEDPAGIAAYAPRPVPLPVVLDAMRRGESPARIADTPPPFLRAHQHDGWRRVMAALDGWNGALLLEPVGSGKTWIALAVAARETRPVVAIVPAILQQQWRDAAERADVRLRIWTHERASRGTPPVGDPGLVIVDEAHRFRNPGSRRVQTIAPWLVGRRSLLVTATPIVNRMSDLITLLRLALPEDALALDGIASLTDLESLDCIPAALRRVAVRSPVVAVTDAHRAVVLLTPDAAEERRGLAAVGAVLELELSDRPPTRRLILSVLLDAAASSDAALGQALRRYRALLLQARDAGGASRSMLRRFAGESLDQLVLWPLFSDHAVPGDLPLADIQRVECLLERRVERDDWTAALRLRCDDGRPTICFARHRATARLLRPLIADQAAWITGSEAGIGAHRLPRPLILDAFGQNRGAWRARREPPRVLVATDVAAEGLDLQAAGRIVHVDLPWTATRMEQREGRLLRIGQRHENVEVVVRIPATAIETALAPRSRIRRKRRIADECLRALEVSANFGPGQVAGRLLSFVADAGGEAALVGFDVRTGCRKGMIVLASEGGEHWSPNPALARRILLRAKRAHAISLDGGFASRRLDDAFGAAQACIGAPQATRVPALVSRVHGLARRAATSRDGTTLQALDRLLRFITASPTLGARIVLARMAEATDAQFLRSRVPDIRLETSPEIVVVAAVFINPAGQASPYRSADAPLR